MAEVALNDFMGHLSHVGELKHEEGAKEAMSELTSLMRGHHIGRNSAGNLKISGALSGKITKTLLNGKGGGGGNLRFV